MKLTCDREKLLDAFQVAAAVAPRKSPKPVLQNVKMSVKESGCTLLATDQEIGVRVDVAGVDAESSGDVLLPVERFGSILRESRDDTLSLTASDKDIVVKGARSRFKLPLADPAEFPDVESSIDDGEHRYVIPGETLATMIRRTVFCADVESSRYALAGVLFEFTEDGLFIIGTDGRRIAKTVHENQTDISASAVVPAKAVQFMSRAVKDGDGEAILSPHHNHIIVKTPTAAVYSRLVEGRYPKWRDVIPSWTEPVVVEVSASELFAAVRQAAIATNEESRGIDVEIGGQAMVLSGSAAEVGSSRIEISVDYSGEPLALTLDHRYLAEFLKVVGDGTVCLEFGGADSPMKLTCEDGYVYVVMPMSKD